MQSLMIVALPRSFSSWTYQTCARLTALRVTSWVSDGEILNLDRYSLRGAGEGAHSAKFLHPARAGRAFEEAWDFLDAVVRPRGFAYKDVVQPFLLAAWAQQQKLAGSLHFVRLHRPLADIAWAMWQRRWFFPAFCLEPSGQGLRVDFLRGLLAAEAALAEIAAPVLQYDALIADPTPLRELLAGWYPGVAARPLPEVDDYFRHQRAEVLRRRERPEYQAMAQEIEALAQAEGLRQIA